MPIAPKKVLTTKSIIKGEDAPVYRFEKGNVLIETSSPINYPCCCFSIFCKLISGSGPFYIRVQDTENVAAQTEMFVPSEIWKRVYASIVAGHNLGQIKCIIEYMGDSPCDCAFTWPQLEKNNIPTSPIPRGQSRARQTVFFNFEQNGVVVFPTGTWVIKFKPELWTSSNLLGDQFRTIFSFLEPHERETLIGFDGSVGGRLVILTREGGEFHRSSTEYFINQTETHSLLLTYDRKSAYLYVNDHPVWSGSPLFEQAPKILFIGCASDDCHSLGNHSNFSLVGWTQELIGYSDSMYHRQIVELTKSLSLRSSVEPRIEGADLIDKYLGITEIEFMSELEFGIQNSKGYIKSGVTEDRIRDQYATYLEGRGFNVSREDYQTLGRTDLTVDYGVLAKEAYQNKFRIEFKIWGRSGYDEAPIQPIKYMDFNERVAIFIMYDFGSQFKFDKMVNIFSQCEVYPMTCKMIDDTGCIFKSQILYFLSEHLRDGENKVLIIGIYIPLPQS